MGLDALTERINQCQAAQLMQDDLDQDLLQSTKGNSTSGFSWLLDKMNYFLPILCMFFFI